MIRPLWMILLCLSVPLSLAGVVIGQQLPELPPTTRGQLSLRLQSLQPEIRRTLAYYYHRPINVAEKTPWSVMHSLVAFGVDTELDAGDRRVNAIGWLCWNQPARGMRLLEIQGSLPAPRQGPGLEGHAGQLLSMLAQSRVRAEYGVKTTWIPGGVAGDTTHRTALVSTARITRISPPGHLAVVIKTHRLGHVRFDVVMPVGRIHRGRGLHDNPAEPLFHHRVLD